MTFRMLNLTRENLSLLSFDSSCVNRNNQPRLPASLG